MNIDQAQQAINARRQGVWDNPALVAIGPLGMTDDDIREIKRRCLADYGFTVGARDPRLNTNYPGQYMVVESHEESELPTKDGRNGPWCVVGDDLNELIEAGYEFLASITD